MYLITREVNFVYDCLGAGHCPVVQCVWQTNESKNESCFCRIFSHFSMLSRCAEQRSICQVELSDYQWRISSLKVICYMERVANNAWAHENGYAPGQDFEHLLHCSSLHLNVLHTSIAWSSLVCNANVIKLFVESNKPLLAILLPFL